jgi:c-di-GMP-binding flagellar brake protein YcgR
LQYFFLFFINFLPMLETDRYSKEPIMTLWENQNPRIERRRYPRKAIQLWVHCAEVKHDKVLRSFTHLTEDLSAGGIAVRSKHLYHLDQPIMTTLLLPPDEAQGDIERALHFSMDEYQPVVILSRVAWCASTEKQYARVGIEFVELPSTGVDLFKKFLINFGLEYYSAPIFQ